MNYLYGAPKDTCAYFKVWGSMDEKKILAATFKGLDRDRAFQKACFGRVMGCYKKERYENYKGCVTNMVNLVFQDTSTSVEYMKTLKHGSIDLKKVSGNVKSYLTSMRSAKFNCAPKGYG